MYGGISLPDFEIAMFCGKLKKMQTSTSLLNFLVVTKKIQIQYKFRAKMVRFHD